MKIFPAIDLKGGKVVQLMQGDYSKVSYFDYEPCEAAQFFKSKGAEYLHIVDLDGAKDGKLSNFDVISRIIRSTDLFVEVGGGIRDEERIEKYLDAGVARVILGTAAVNNFEFLCEAALKYKEKIAVGVDARDGFVAVDGWLTVTKLDGIEFCRKVRDVGVKNVIYTDISRDGAMKGMNFDIYEKLMTVEGLEITASGGVSTLDDLIKLDEIGITAAITGTAVYTGAIDLEEAINRLKK